MSDVSGSGLPPAGWYDDPEQAGQQRFWDGSRWTDQRRPGVQAPPPAPMGTPGAYASSPTLANPWKRLGARVLDGLILGVAGVVLFAITGGVAALGDFMNEAMTSQTPPTGLPGSLFVRLVLISVIVGVGYEVTLTALKGQTLGKMALSLKVVKEDTGEVPGWGPAGIRWVIPAVAGLIPIIGGLLALLVYAAVLWDPRNQGWHDKPAKTLVVDA